MLSPVSLHDVPGVTLDFPDCQQLMACENGAHIAGWYAVNMQIVPRAATATEEAFAVVIPVQHRSDIHTQLVHPLPHRGSQGGPSVPAQAVPDDGLSLETPHLS